METKDKIKKLRAQITELRSHLKGAKGQMKQDLQKKITELEKQLQMLLSENPHDDGTGRKPISPRGEQRPASKSPKRPGY